MEEKKCNKCNETKSFNAFSKCKNKKQGISSLCKICHSKYRKEHYLKNKDKVIKQVNDYRLNNLEKYNIKKEYKPKSQIKNKKAGRIFSGCCFICDNFVYVTKKDLSDKLTKHYCSNECRLKNKKSFYYHYLKNVKRRANIKKIAFELTEDFLINLLEVKQKNLCAVTNCPIKIRHYKESATLYDTASLDRIDNTKGYTMNNVQWVMLGINYMKLDFDLDELHKTLKLIKENYK